MKVLVIEQLRGYTVASRLQLYKDKQSTEAENYVNDGIPLHIYFRIWCSTLSRLKHKRFAQLCSIDLPAIHILTAAFTCIL